MTTGYRDQGVSGLSLVSGPVPGVSDAKVLLDLLRISADAALVVDERQRIVLFNRKAEVIFGYGAGEVLGRGLEVLVPERFRTAHRHHVARFAESAASPQYMEERGRFIGLRKSGQEFPAHIAISRLDTEGGPLFTAMVRDISEQTRAHTHMERRAAVLKVVADASHRFLSEPYQPAHVADLLAGLGEAVDASRAYVFENHRDVDRMLYCQQRFEWIAEGVTSQLGNPLLQRCYYHLNMARWPGLLGRGETLQGHVRDFPGDERTLLGERQARSVLVVPIWSEDRWWGFMGFDECREEREWAEPEVDALRTAAAVFGAAEGRRRSERAFRESEERYQRLFDNIPDMYLTIDAERRILAINQYGAAHLGYRKDELEGQSVEVLVYPGDLVEVRAYLERVAAGEAPAGPLTFRKVRKDETTIWVEERVRPISGGREGRPELMVMCRDVTRQRLSEGALEGSQQRYHTLFDAAAVALCEEDWSDLRSRFEALRREGVEDLEAYLQRHPGFLAEAASLVRVVDVNQAAVRMFRAKSKDELRGGLDERLPFASPGTFRDEAVALFQGKGHYECESTRQTVDGVEVHVLLRAAVLDGGPVTDRILVSLMDITERKRDQERLVYMAKHDPLTELPNRGLFMDRLSSGIARARRNQAPLALLYLDLDNFKPVNDRFGHHLGDQLLKAVAGRLRRMVREVDTVARIGGDEFAVILEGLTGFADARGTAKKLSDALREPFQIQGQELGLGASIGIALYPEDAEDLDALIRFADLQMYQGKRMNGRLKISPWMRET